LRAANRPETLWNRTEIQWVMAQIRYLAEQWNFGAYQRISPPPTIEYQWKFRELENPPQFERDRRVFRSSSLPAAFMLNC
jgi:uncharacterized protein YndB with AHSA1/START domain